MALDLNRYYVFIFLLLASCSQAPEEQLVKKLSTHYANIGVNNPEEKSRSLKSLESLLKQKKLNDENLPEIKKSLSQFNDGHVVLFDSRKEKNKLLESSLNFYPGSFYVESCPTCNPSISVGKYKIVKVNDDTFDEFIEKEKSNVSASTEWARKFRTSRLLATNSKMSDIKLTLIDQTGRSQLTQLQWSEVVTRPAECVKAERIDPKNLKLIIYSFWCDDLTSPDHSRSAIFNNFKKQFDRAAEQVSPTDKIILDLRENGGGADLEVEYVLNSFFQKSVFMYKYQYLNRTHPGKKKWIAGLWPFSNDQWSPVEVQFSDPLKNPSLWKFDNKIVTLISAGCFSSCEGLASILKLEGRSILIGERTHGGAGEPIVYPLLGTPYSINLPGCLVWQKNEELYEGVGVKADIPLYQSENLVEDTLLKKAIDLVQ